MKKWIWITAILIAIIIIAVIVINANAAAAEEEVPVTDENGITYYPDGSQSFQTQYDSGTITQTTILPDGSMTVATIVQGEIPAPGIHTGHYTGDGPIILPQPQPVIN